MGLDHSPAALTDRLYAAFGSRRLGARLGSVFLPDAQVNWPTGQATGLGEIEMAFLPLWQALEPVSLTVLDLITTDEIALARLQLTGRHTHPGVLGPPSNQQETCTGAVALSLSEGRIYKACLVPGHDIHGDHPLQDLPAHQTPPSEWANALTTVVRQSANGVARHYTPAAEIQWTGQPPGRGPDAAEALWSALHAAVPDAALSIRLALGQQVDLERPKAAVWWRLSGSHTGFGPIGPPTGDPVVIDGITFASFAPGGLHHEDTVLSVARNTDGLP